MYEQYSPQLFGYLRRRVGEGLAEDILQETFLRFYRHIYGHGPVENPRAYLFQVGRHTMYRQAKKQGREISESPNEFYDTPDEQPASTPSEILDREVVDLLRRALREVPPPEGDMMRLRWEQGFSVPELAVVFQKSERQIRRWQEKAAKHMRDFFYQRGLSFEDIVREDQT